MVQLRRSEWIASREQFEHALVLDVNSAPALEGLGCLLTDAGQLQAARPFLHRALVLQPANARAQECLAYAQPQCEPALRDGVAVTAPAVRVQALAAILAGDTQSAQQWLRTGMSRRAFEEWADALLRAAADLRRVPDALQAITVAASEGRIDAWTEILCGAALKQSDFVFNRISRLQRLNEPAPLRVLWVPQAGFLRRHARFEPTVGAAGLPAFWQEYGTPDVCASEPQIHGCRRKPVQ